eukprot:6399954-Alexandrium_andersonii.AAC.1
MSSRRAGRGSHAAAGQGGREPPTRASVWQKTLRQPKVRHIIMPWAHRPGTSRPTARHRRKKRASPK